MSFMNDTALAEARSFHTRLIDLLRVEFTSLGAFLEALAEFDRRKLFRDLGHADLFSYLQKGLKLSRAAAHHRRAAARLVERFPEVLEPIREGKLCFTTAAVLASVVTEENVAAVLPRFYGLSKQEALELAAELKPRPVVPVRTVVTIEDVKTTVPEIRPGEPGIPRTEAQRTLVEPMTAVVSRIHITVSREFLALLKKAKAGESHRNPGATDEQVLTAALQALIEKQGKRKASVPARVKREVMKRDEGKCQWKLADGGICGATVRLEIDHVQPRGRGGSSTVENCRLLCKAHNLEAAREAYGDAHMDLFAAREEVATYGPLDNPIVHPPAPGVGCRPCSGRKPPRSGSSACASRSCSSSDPGSSSSTTRARPWACRSAGGRRTTSGRCTSAPWPRRPTSPAG
jgi:5-methylcytosine-specific restriction endonuclease McrA